MRKCYLLSVVMTTLLLTHPTHAQMESALINEESHFLFNAAQFESIKWRNIGPFRGGRSNAVCGVKGRPMTYYMGTVGGGVWKTKDAGMSWTNISDGFFRSSSVGAIAVAESDPNIVYVGMGEHAVRGVMTSAGDGVYKSTDAGKTWEYLGLGKTQHISAIRIHPQDPDIVWIAAQGALYGPSRERGIFKTTDGGKNWEHVLYIDKNTGAADLSLDPFNPRILYAATWDHQRTPWHIRSGGSGSGIYKSTDGGLNWVKLSEGLPEKMGKVGVDVSPADPERVYAIVEAETGGVFQSINGGESWTQVSKDRLTYGRAWYYNKIVADRQDPETVYILNAPLLKSTDGGRTFTSIDNPHSDQHHLWINPDNPENMILANDGGACITFNGGKSWSSQQNQPTAQFYRVIADNRFPYHVYAGQQDNTSIAIPSRTTDLGIGAEHWYPVAGGESAFITFDPDQPNQIYGTSYLGSISVYNEHTRQTKDIMAYPVIGLATDPVQEKFRFNWNAPVIVNPHQPTTLYHAAQKVFKSEDGGLEWKVISPDLTRNESGKQGSGGGPFINEGAGGEVYNTISYMAYSPHRKGTIWVGTDDGLVHITQDEGKNWMNVTPPDLQESLINSIEVSRHHPGAAYVVATRYKFMDNRPLVYYTANFGKTWRKITGGFPENAIVRVVREDPTDPFILYAGTENGFYISFDKGKYWHAFQLNLPVCPVTDLFIQDNDLIASTAGRSFWILDDLGPIQQSKGFPDDSKIALFRPKPGVRIDALTPEGPVEGLGQNPLTGVIIDYYLPEKMDTALLQLDILDESGELVRSYSNLTDSSFIQYDGGPIQEAVLPSRKGFNRFNWDLRRESLPGVPEVFVMGDYRGGMVAPGSYTLRLSTSSFIVETELALKADPRLGVDAKDFAQQDILLKEIEHQIKDIHNAINRMRDVKIQVKTLTGFLKKSEDYKDLVQTGKSAIERISEWEKNLIQTKQQTFQDVINFPSRLNAELLNLKAKVDSHDPRVTKGATNRFDDLKAQWIEQKTQMQNILNREVASFNQKFKERNIPVLIIPQASAF